MNEGRDEKSVRLPPKNERNFNTYHHTKKELRSRYVPGNGTKSFEPVSLKALIIFPAY